MAVPEHVAQALQTLTAQINEISSRIQNLEGRDVVTPQQLEARSVELRNLSQQAVQGVQEAVQQLQMWGADAAGAASRGFNLINDKNDAPSTSATRRTTT